MHTNIKTLLAVASLCVANLAVAQERVYVIDERGEVVINSTGQCWRTGFWNPTAVANDPAGCACDRDLLPSSVCTPTTIPVVVAKPARVKATIAADTLFDFDKAVLRADGKAELDRIVTALPQLNLEVILVVGHTDRIGSKAYNQKLSDRRANAVKNYLTNYGVPADRIHTSGMGELQPVTTDCKGVTPNRDLIACLQPDRRVEIEVIGSK